MVITANVTVTRDGHRWPTETITNDIASETVAGAGCDLHQRIATALEDGLRDALEVDAGDWVDIEIAACPENPDLVGKALTWIV
ncbi:Uncharacterised protein (plasmid) [Tsukamurella tyrosinosolvens]|uniref:Uncharacterized protein n=1 Tax=Tsukamurella tyrosinosolvens TaxID=57704 RepID=A0A1H4VCS1_TSUTY|nr:hypothetical protein [Tsukamurella tyrosinosolvens]KXO91005.1 hypothetical protein AXK58_21480 [Tsukamurella tyrosinosolvens]SEC78922.1 hypothetical protein SAMN04489793_3197 [Tsukamurella tyrosinosolvens]VEH90580.1 Uncharacterised protein [Tsukamurella tyrosinosolvens]